MIQKTTITAVLIFMAKTIAVKHFAARWSSQRMNTALSKLNNTGEAGRELGGISVSAIKRIALEIGIEPMLTVGGALLFIADQAERSRTERIRRARESAR